MQGSPFADADTFAVHTEELLSKLGSHIVLYPVSGIITRRNFIMKNQKLKTMTQTAIFIALVAVLAFVPFVGYIKIPVLAIQATTVHIPVIVGSILLGPKAGAILGFEFGLTSLINNTVTPGITSFCFSPFVEVGEGLGGSPLALIICFVPRILVGVVPYFVYKGIMKLFKNGTAQKGAALAVSGVAGSMTNTILVMSMIYLFFGEEWAAAKEISYNAVLGVIGSVIAINGTIEAIVAAVIATAVIAALLKSKVIKEK